MSKTALLAWALLGIIWGSNFIFMKWATEYISPMQVVLARVFLGFIPILAYALVTRQLKLSDMKFLGHFLIMACLAAVVYYYGFAKGTQLLPSGIAGAISGSIPLFSVFAAVLLLKEEKLTVPRIQGLLIGMAGVLAIARPFESSENFNVLEGTIYMVIGSLSLGASFVYARRFVTPLKLSAATLTTYQLGIASIVLFLITPISGIDHIFSDTTALLGLVVGLGLLGTGVAYILYYYIIKHMGAVNASTVTYLPPIVALLIGSILVGEQITALDYLGSALILGGVFVMNRNTEGKSTAE